MVAVEAVKPLMKNKMKLQCVSCQNDKSQGVLYKNAKSKLLGLRGGGFWSFLDNYLISQIE